MVAGAQIYAGKGRQHRENVKAKHIQVLVNEVAPTHQGQVDEHERFQIKMDQQHVGRGLHDVEKEQHRAHLIQVDPHFCSHFPEN